MNDDALASLDMTGWKIGTVPCSMENFLYNTGVTSINLKNAGDKISNISLAFADNSGLTEIVLPDAADAFANVKNAFGAFSDDVALTKIVKTDGTSGFSATDAADLRGMFCNDTALTVAGIPDAGVLISSAAGNTSYMFKDCPALTSVDMSNADTTNVKYLQGMFDGDTALAGVTINDGANKFVSSSALDTGTMFRDCALTDTTAQKAIDALSDTKNVTDMYAMFEGNEALKTVDFSGMDFKKVKDLSRFAYGCDALGVIADADASELTKAGLAKITIPSDFASATDAAGRTNVFYVAKDAKGGELDPASLSDDVTTYLAVDSATFPANMKAYPWSKDNRKFSVLSAQSINEVDGAKTYTYSDDKDATLKITALPTLTLNNKPAELSYAWTHTPAGGKAASLEEKDTDYVAKKADYGDGLSHTFTVTAAPAAMTDSLAAGTLAPAEADFVLGAKITGIKATYTGNDVPVGTKYDKDDVKVEATLSTGDTVTLPSASWTPSGDTVKQPGDNTFRATYKDGDDTYTADYTVPGKRVIGSIVAKYIGPAVLVGDSYDEANVETTAYYSDDKDKKEGFAVTPTSYSGKKVGSVGSNTFTATYKDPDQKDKSFTSQFVVPGYKQVGYIDAEYKGPAVTVGNDYKKSDVVVTVHYADGSGQNTLSESDWTPDSKTVTAEGDNSFTATYKDPFGNTFTAGYSVKGVASTSEPAPSGDSDNGDPADLTDTYQGYDNSPSSSTPTSGKSSYGVPT